MSRNDAEEYVQRLYARVPAHYRVYDAEQGLPLLALLRVVGMQVANLRQDLDVLWDNFFVETCEEWALPYIATLAGTNVLAHPVGHSNRLDIRNTVRWRRSKGTPAMLSALTTAITGWNGELAEFFRIVGWSQQLNHLRPERSLTVDLHDPFQLSQLGAATDPFAHAADFRPSRPLDQPRVIPRTLGVGVMAWSTPGRYAIKELGVFVHRLQTFAVRDATPAAGPPGPPAPNNAALYTFDPLFRNAPLFSSATSAPLSRSAFDHAPWQSFGGDVAVRQFGILLASDVQPSADHGSSASPTPFTFDNAAAGLTLDPSNGIRLMDAPALQHGGVHFVITASMQSATTSTTIGTLSTLHAVMGDGDAYHKGNATTEPGSLVITVQTGRASLGWPGIPPSPPARFPGAVLAVRAAGSGPLQESEGLYIHLPAVAIRPDQALTFFIADDGSSYTGAALTPATLARAAEGQVYPPRPLTHDVTAANEFISLSRGANGLRLSDPSRFRGSGALIQAELFTGTFQPLGALATIVQSQAQVANPDLVVPDNWPALSYAPSKAAQADALPTGELENGHMPLLTILIKPLAGATMLPPCELIVGNRAGQSLLVYLPGLSSVASEGQRLFVGADGSTFEIPTDNSGQQHVLEQGSFSGLKSARASAGQVLPIGDVWPLQQRRPVAINLCRAERNGLLHPGELGIDPELGRFAFAPGDPAITGEGLSVDYVEAFGDRVGARSYDRQLDLAPPPTRVVAHGGDATLPGMTLAADHIHASLADAVANATDADVIEIADSATYAAADALIVNRPGLKRLVIRAAERQRPCLTFYQASGAPTNASLHITAPLDSLELNGVLISGGPLMIDSIVTQLQLVACTLDPLVAGSSGSLVSTVVTEQPTDYLLCRCIAGGLRLGIGVRRLLVADSILDHQGGLAIGGVLAADALPQLDPPAQAVQLERVTVLGRVRCDLLTASECLLDDIAVVDDQQAGGMRFSRYERGSTLPRRYHCVPSDSAVRACPPHVRCTPPRFNSRSFGRPDYGQLATACSQEILTASESGAEVGAFASALNTIRLGNQATKLQEFLPVGLSALMLAET